jgi:pimeloyl-ACP methyl ester carboxylesterase
VPPASTSPAPKLATSRRAASVAQPTVVGVFAAAGVRQWLHCRGTGRVTVVVITGLAAPATSWAGVRSALEGITRTCVYDRPGLGRSPARKDLTQVVDAGLYARELGALLAAAGERGPFVVVGHSFGGLIARAFIRSHQKQIRGVLLAESVTPDDPTSGAYWAEAGHKVDMVASSRAADGRSWGRVPLVVLSASDPEEDHLGGPAYQQPSSSIVLWRQQQQADLLLSENAIQVIAHSGHVLQQDDPAAVVEATRELVGAATSGQRLRCTSVWTSADTTCR